MTESTLTSDLAACVWIPLFALRCEESRRPELSHKPNAVLSPEDSRRVWQVSPRARHQGVRPGMTIGQAIGLCGSLAVFEPDPIYYDDQFARLLLALSNISPVVEPAELGRVFVGVDGLEGLYGSPEEQLKIILAAVRSPSPVWERGTGGEEQRPAKERGDRGEARLGWGRGKFVAWVAASRAKPGEGLVIRDGEEKKFLASQPIAVLPMDPDSHHRLWRLGLKTLGQLIAIPESAVVSQFGKEGRAAWQLAAGLVKDPVIGTAKPQPIVAGLEFSSPIADRTILAGTLERLIDQALRHPRRIGWRVVTARVRAVLEQGASWMIDATLKDPSAERARIAAPLLVKLEQSPPTGAVEKIIVSFTAFAPGTTELQLFARDAQSAARAGRRRALRSAAGEIKTRLNHSNLYRVIEVHPWSRLPERRFALIDFDP
ncbi:MAG: hypothetical protein EXR93_03840 [Gemmatimonadetes bacterium]|nr:hypothetical protein [Gemmatimonadota bacterium]